MGSKFTFTGEIHDPPRSSRFAAAILVCLIIVWTLTLALPGPSRATSFLGRSWGTWFFCATVLMLPLTIASRSIYAVHVGIFILLYFLRDAFPHFSRYPLRHLTLLVLYAYAVMAIPALRRSVGWLRVGKLDAKIWLFLLSAVLLAGLALVLWVGLLSPDLSRWTGMLPNMSFGPLLAGGIGLCAFNAAREEIIWRGVMMEALDSAFGAGYWSLLVQALSFGLAHYQTGFPNGTVGSAMTFLYGLILGIIRRKSRGMFGCWVAHFLADCIIFCLILYESAR